jgi:hypothetical protein
MVQVPAFARETPLQASVTTTNSALERVALSAPEAVSPLLVTVKLVAVPVTPTRTVPRSEVAGVMARLLAGIAVPVSGTDTVSVADPESVTTRVAASAAAPTTVGVKTTEMVQLASGARIVQPVEVALKSAALAPVTATPSAPVATSPELARPKTIAELGTLTVVANACVVLGLITSLAGAWAIAVMGTVTTLPLAPPALTTRLSLFGPAEVAVKLTTTMQEVLAASAATQVLVASLVTSAPFRFTARSVSADFAPAAADYRQHANEPQATSLEQPSEILRTRHVIASVETQCCSAMRAHCSSRNILGPGLKEARKKMLNCAFLGPVPPILDVNVGDWAADPI